MTAWIAIGDLFAVEDHADGTLAIVVPVTVGELLAVGQQPDDVLASRTTGCLPEKNRLRRSTGCSRRSATTRCTYRSITESNDDQSSQRQLVVLTVRIVVALLGSADLVAAQIIGQPWESRTVAIRLRRWRSRRVRISSSSVSPSAPQFHERLSLAPSSLPSPLASLCFLLYDTRSRSVKPSCAVTKLMLAHGWRPSHSYRLLDPVRQFAMSRTPPASPRQKSRTVSRYAPFHSAQRTGKLPT